MDAGVRSWLKDALVMGQTIAINGAVNELAKVVFSRPRPLLYGRPLGDPELSRGDNYASFYSEHTSGTFAIGIAYAMTYALRHPHSPLRYVLGGAVLLIGSTVGALRVLSGKHFPTDVVAGAAVGATFGWLVPTLHANVREAQLGLVPLTGGAALTIAFSVL
jgi:membrane-associated phospholipid phosphatase